MQANWEQSSAWSPSAMPHLLVVAFTTVAIVLAVVVLCVVFALAVPSGTPLSPPGPLPGPGLDL